MKPGDRVLTGLLAGIFAGVVLACHASAQQPGRLNTAVGQQPPAGGIGPVQPVPDSRRPGIPQAPGAGRANNVQMPGMNRAQAQGAPGPNRVGMRQVGGNNMPAAGNNMPLGAPNVQPVQPPGPVDVKAALKPEMIRWAGPPIRSLDVFRDKTVIVLVYATWCPKCNSWSGEFFQQLKEVTATRPVVILAINTDESPRGMQEYLTQRGFFAPNIFHGYDPMLPKRLGLQSNLFQAAIIRPDGEVTGMQYAGTFSNTPAGRQFTLPRMISQSTELGRFRFISPDMSPEGAQLLWPLELGPFSETALRRVQARLSDEDKAKLEEAIEKFLDARLAEIRELYYGELADKLRAYDLSVELAKMFRNREQCATARRVVAALEAQPGFKRELAAKRSYEKMSQSAQARPDQRASLLFRVARAFEGTYYGELARREAEAAQSQPPASRM